MLERWKYIICITLNNYPIYNFFFQYLFQIAVLFFQIVENSTKIYKGSSSEVDSYSVFWDNMKLVQTSLVSQLQSKNVTDLYVCGIAYDVCVGKYFFKLSTILMYQFQKPTFPSFTSLTTWLRVCVSMVCMLIMKFVFYCRDIYV